VISESWKDKRRVIPRWRSFDNTLAVKELASPILASNARFSATAYSNSPWFTHKLEQWHIKHDLLTAVELVEAGIVESREHEAVSAARQLALIFDDASVLQKNQARLLLIRNGYGGEVSNASSLRSQHSISIRNRLADNPHDAIAWVDLSRNYLLAKRPEKAKRAMSVALQLAPHNRHVLRSACRLYLNQNENDRAHSILTRSVATPHDPWLTAAEIATADYADKQPKFVRVGRAMIEDNQFSVKHKAELSAAIATLDMIGGNGKRARKLFAASMVDPTGNSWAQAEWASLKGGAVIERTRESLLSESESSEACALHAHRNGKFVDALDYCQLWIMEEPFSIRPHVGAATTAALLERHCEAIKLAETGLNVDPESQALINVLAFSHASLGELSHARRYAHLKRVKNPTSYLDLVMEANRGLIAFRSGDITEGIARYKYVESTFRRQNMIIPSASALVYLAREGTIARQAESKQWLSEAKARIKDLSAPEVECAIALLEARQIAAPAPLSDLPHSTLNSPIEPN
jgi:tetratricopeptide (TPR) repeat protein